MSPNFLFMSNSFFGGENATPPASKKVVEGLPTMCTTAAQEGNFLIYYTFVTVSFSEKIFILFVSSQLIKTSISCML